MPIFEYRCKKCGNVTEFLEKAGSRKPHPCDKCGSGDTEKAFSTFSAQVAAPETNCATCPNSTCPMR